MPPPETIPLTARCLCNLNTFTHPLPTTSLPLPAWICHCTSCRHLTGALHTIGTPWPIPRSKTALTPLALYEFSSDFRIRFCRTCSTPMFWERAESEELIVFVGCLGNVDVKGGQFLEVKRQIFVGDTRDGGASCWLRGLNEGGKGEVRRFVGREGSDELDVDWPKKEDLTGYEKRDGPDEIPIRCRCKGVDFRLRRGNYGGKSGDELPGIVDPETGKLKASFDACDSCRLFSGVDFINWTFSELCNIGFAMEGEMAQGKRFPATAKALKAAVDAGDPAFGTLKYYASSPDVQRYFCGRCSASVFYSCDERTNWVDVAVGLLDSPDGARAEGYLSWMFGAKPTYMGDVEGGWREELWKRVQEEAELWRVKRGYAKNYWRLKLEEDE